MLSFNGTYKGSLQAELNGHMSGVTKSVMNSPCVDCTTGKTVQRALTDQKGSGQRSGSRGRFGHRGRGHYGRGGGRGGGQSGGNSGGNNQNNSQGNFNNGVKKEGKRSYCVYCRKPGTFRRFELLITLFRTHKRRLSQASSEEECRF